ncbi:AI-2E family transporter [Agrilactobacillus yilanensis]|uniref:AI-2E family transporter n=1 Tax=Agrilactobacillus yilanensis TaxID=2485997 RepID=A0ABW4J490_9LACO|nr:AI-2E family transporter [Agrilactobacillus yilanensis]
MELYDRFLKNERLRRMTVLVLLIAILWLVRSAMNTLLLTFIFTYLVVHLIRLVQRKFPKFSPIFVVIPLYLLIIAGLYFVISHYMPILMHQFTKLFNLIYHFLERPDVDSNAIMSYVSDWVQKLNLNAQIKSSISEIIKYATNIGGAGITFFVSFLLSFFYALEVDKLDHFGKLFLKSDYGWFFEDLYYFGQKFVNSFGVVLEAQLLIAVVNTILTTITITVMGLPSVVPLAAMVFFLSLIPVAGVVVSLIPLSFVAYTVGGFRYIIYILIMIIIIHAIEAYILNPKFMSSRTQLPVFFTFVVLLAAERLFGTWGLIVGIPIFTFFLDVLGVKEIGGSKKKGPKLPFDPEQLKKHKFRNTKSLESKENSAEKK